MFQLRLSECFWVLTVCSPGLITSIYTTMAGDSSWSASLLLICVYYGSGSAYSCMGRPLEYVTIQVLIRICLCSIR